MKKESLIWLIVKATGCVFGYWAVMSSLTFIGSLYMLMQTPLLGEFAWAVAGQIVYVAIYWSVATYLLRDGRLLFDVLNMEDDEIKDREPVIETSLNLDDR